MSSATFFSPQVSDDLIWSVVRSQNSFLVKSRGGVQFSRDPMNLTNVHSRKYAGFVNSKAVGVQAAAGDKGGVTLIKKKAAATQKPSAVNTINFKGNKSQRKTYKAVANAVTKSHYRGDLRAVAVSRTSAVIRSQRPVKASPVSKPRGNAAKAVAASEEN